MEHYDWSSSSKLLGEGSEGEVRLAKDKQSGQMVAVKKTHPHLFSNISKEEQILKNCRHENVIKLLDAVSYDKRGSFMVFEYMEENLKQRMSRKLPRVEVKSIMQQILRGLAHVHVKGYMHLDVKPQNVLLNSTGQVKLADFGCAIKQSIHVWDYPAPNEVGTIEFNAPELLLGLRRYGTKADVWSAGCIFMQLLLGKDFLRQAVSTTQGSPERQIMDGIITWIGKPDEKNWPGVSRLPKYKEMVDDWSPEASSVDIKSEINDPAAAELVLKMLCLDPRKRITAQEALKSDYFNNGENRADPAEWKPLPIATGRSLKRFEPAWRIPTTPITTCQ